MYHTWMKDKVIRLRWKKYYPEASSHVAIGKVCHETSGYLALKCRTFHFNKVINGKGIREGSLCVRMMPWDTIEVMHELEPDTDYKAPLVMDSKGTICLDNKYRTVITKERDFGE